MEERCLDVMAIFHDECSKMMGLFGGKGVLFSLSGRYVATYRKSHLLQWTDAIYVSWARGLASISVSQ